MTRMNFNDYWHIGKAQIMSGKITESDFKNNIIDLLEHKIVSARIEELENTLDISVTAINERIATLKKGLE